MGGCLKASKWKQAIKSKGKYHCPNYRYNIHLLDTDSVKLPVSYKSWFYFGKDLIPICSYAMRGCRGDGASCFLQRRTDGIRGNKHMLECGKFSLNIRNKSFHNEDGLVLKQDPDKSWNLCPWSYSETTVQSSEETQNPAMPCLEYKLESEVTSSQLSNFV